MLDPSIHEINLHPSDIFKTLLDHEVNKSRRYGDSLTLVDILVEPDPSHPEARDDAGKFAIQVLAHSLRETDISTRLENEFLILMPSTSGPGARTACERVRKIMFAEHQAENGVAYKLSIFVGMASLPIDHSISSDEFTQNAAHALQYARSHQLTGVIAFSDIPK